MRNGSHPNPLSRAISHIQYSTLFILWGTTFCLHAYTPYKCNNVDLQTYVHQRLAFWCILHQEGGIPTVAHQWKVMQITCKIFGMALTRSLSSCPYSLVPSQSGELQLHSIEHEKLKTLKTSLHYCIRYTASGFWWLLHQQEDDERWSGKNPKVFRSKLLL